MANRFRDERAPWAAALAAALAAAALAGCGPRAGEDDLPGAFWAGRADAVRSLLGQLAQLEGTRLGRVAGELAAALPACDRVGAHAPDGDLAALRRARCLGPDDPLERARAREDAALRFALPHDGSGGPVQGVLRERAGGFALDLLWRRPPAGGALGLLVPGREPAGPDRLAATGRLVHLRLRPHAGIDLAALVPADGQADHLFRLRSGLFTRTVLDGTWEAAAYLPETAGGVPGAALALGFRVRSAAVAAAESFLADLEQTWPVRRSALALPAGAGACLLDLNLLPELAPCYVVTEDALVVGWNRASLERALGGAREPAPEGTREAAGRLDVDLALIGRADALLTRHFSVSDRPLRWPWTRLRAAGGVSGRDLRLRVQLQDGPRGAS